MPIIDTQNRSYATLHKHFHCCRQHGPTFSNTRNSTKVLFGISLVVIRSLCECECGWVPACLPACLPASLPPCLPACLPARLAVCLFVPACKSGNVCVHTHKSRIEHMDSSLSACPICVICVCMPVSIGLRSSRGVRARLGIRRRGYTTS